MNHELDGKPRSFLYAEIDRLRARLEESYAKQTYKEWERNHELIAELAEELASRIDWRVAPLRGDLLQRAMSTSARPIALRGS